MDDPFCPPAIGVDISGLDAKGIEDFLTKADSCVSAGGWSRLQLYPSLVGHEGCEESELLWGHHAVAKPEDCVASYSFQDGYGRFNSHLSVPARVLRVQERGRRLFYFSHETFVNSLSFWSLLSGLLAVG